MNSRPSSSEQLPLLVEAFTEALVAGDPAAADRVVRDAIDGGLSPESIDEGVIAPAMRQIGELWRRGEISVAEEHLATDISYRTLALQREAFRVARRRPEERVMLAAVESERHVLGLEMAHSLLGQAGYDVRQLGPDVPIESLRPIVERHKPQVFGFTVTMASASGLLRLAIDEVRRAAPSIRVIVGGPGVPQGLAETYWLTTMRGVSGVAEEVDSLLRRPSLN